MKMLSRLWSLFGYARKGLSLVGGAVGANKYLAMALVAAVVALGAAGWALKHEIGVVGQYEQANADLKSQIKAAQQRSRLLEAQLATTNSVLAERERKRNEIVHRAATLQRQLKEAQDHGTTGYQTCRNMRLPGGVVKLLRTGSGHRVSH